MRKARTKFFGASVYQARA